MQKRGLSLLAVLFFFLVAATAHADSVAGNSFTFQYYYPTSTSTLAGSNTFVADGTTYSSPTGGFTYAISPASQLIITFTGGGTWPATSFNGPQFTDNSELINSVLFNSAASTASTYATAAISYPSANAFAINFGGQPIPTGARAVFDINGTAVTPEPSSLWLLGTGVVAGAGALRRRIFA